MSLYGQSISEDSLVMLRRVLGDECAGRNIDIDGVEGEEMALLLTHAFRAGMTDPRDLVGLSRNCVEIGGDDEKVIRQSDNVSPDSVIL